MSIIDILMMIVFFTVRSASENNFLKNEKYIIWGIIPIIISILQIIFTNFKTKL